MKKVFSVISVPFLLTLSAVILSSFPSTGEAVPAAWSQAGMLTAQAPSSSSSSTARPPSAQAVKPAEAQPAQSPAPAVTETKPAEPPAAEPALPAEAVPEETRPAVAEPQQRAPGQMPAVVPPRRELPFRRAAAQAAGGPVSFFFDDADVFEVVQTVFGDVLKVNYIIDPKVKGKVNFRTITPIPREEVLPVMETILRINGIGFVEEKGLYRIIPLTEVPKELVYAQVGKDPGRVAIDLFTFKNVNMKEAMADIENAIGLNVQGGTVRILPIWRLNALLVITSSKEQLEYIRRWIEAFDTMFAGARPKVLVYPLQNSKAAHVASMLQAILGGGAGAAAPAPAAPKAPTAGAPAPAAPAAPKAGPAVAVTGTGFLVSPETRIFADEITNSLVILATPADYSFIEETIKKIDTVSRQVVIEGVIARVDLTDNLSFGLSWSFNTDVNIKGLRPFRNDEINLKGDVSVNPGAISFKDSVLQLPGKGFSFVGTDPRGVVRALITALAEESKAKVLAAPHILVSDNREARIQVGRQVPIATSTTTTPIAGGTTTAQLASTSTIQYKDIGIILKVKPQVNDSGLVSLEITQEISSLGETVRVGGLDEISINKTEATTNLVAQDGETIIIGGLIQEDVSKSKDGIPLLSKIPILGNLFGNTTDKNTRTELIILLTPHVVKNMQEAENVTTDYIERYKGSTRDKDIDQFIKERGQKGKSGSDTEKRNDR